MYDVRNIADILIDDGRPNGVVLHMPRAGCYETLSRMNFSTLKKGFVGTEDIDPALIREAFEEREPPPSQDLQDSYDRGTLLHLILLQPEEIAGRVAVWQGKTRSGHEWEAFKRDNPKKLIMKASDVRDVQMACREFKRMKLVRDILRPCDTEVTVLTKEGNVFVKAMLDAVTREGDGLCMMVDPKSSRNGISHRAVMRTIETMFYREQMGSYVRWFKSATDRDIEQVFLLFVSLPPQRIGVRRVRLTTEDLQFGASRMLAAMAAVEQCLKTGEWPAFCVDDICDIYNPGLDDLEIEGI